MTSRKYKMYYDYNKRTKGGFLDVIFLSSIMIIGGALLVIALTGGR